MAGSNRITVEHLYHGHASTRDITHDGLNVAWAALAIINAARASINIALTLIWHLKKIESKSNPDRSNEDSTDLVGWHVPPGDRNTRV